MLSFISQKLSLKHMLQSVFSAFIGIQKSSHAQADFKYGNLWVYGALGIIAATVFVVTIWSVVRLVLSV